MVLTLDVDNQFDFLSNFDAYFNKIIFGFMLCKLMNNELLSFVLQEGYPYHLLLEYDRYQG